MMDFKQAQAYLDGLQMHKIKLGLEAMEEFLERVGRPEKKLRFVHVAGTNGKGSVSVNVVTVLTRAGYRVGLFTSPHLSSVRERFRIGGDYIDEETFARLASRIRAELGAGMITYFEFTTALALLWFAESEVDLVVLETGLGGRLDATNVVSPLVTVITNVSMDHEAYLGNHLAAIAAEKAGIIKAGVPLVTGVADDDGRTVVEERCRQLGAPLYLCGRDFVTADESAPEWSWRGCTGEMTGKAYGGLRCGMKGAYQLGNSALAVAVLTLLQNRGYPTEEEHLRRGLAEVLWPGRLEYIVLPDRVGGEQRRFLIDGAHNPAGVASLVQTLVEEYAYDRLIVVWGAMEDKDLSQTLPPVAALAHLLILTRPPGERAAKPGRLREILAAEVRERCLLEDEMAEALRLAEEKAGPGDLIVVAGSLYLLGEIRRLLLGEVVP